MNVTDRFIEYVKYDTKSDEENISCPSTSGQSVLANKLRDDLKAIGVTDVTLDGHGYVYAKIAANTDKIKKKTGFIAHMDTSPAVSGKDVKPQIMKYDGKPLLLNEEKQIRLSVDRFTNLNKYIGKELIVTDGTTLLGADDKAGVAEILTAVDIIIKNNLPHGEIRIAFTPDEEIGRGADLFDVAFFDADYAYTVDGGALGELEYENFNAASAVMKIHGRSVHPGSAKGMMINASLVACEINSMLPLDEIPEKTEKYEGFYHLTDIHSDVEEATVKYIIRDHDKENFRKRKEKIVEIVNGINKKYGENTVDLLLSDSYYNMKDIIDKNIEIIEYAKNAMLKAGVQPQIVPIRGGTDGAMLSFRGLPCPNICTGGENFHSRFEYIPIESMEKTVEIIKNLITDAE